LGEGSVEAIYLNQLFNGVLIKLLATLTIIYKKNVTYSTAIVMTMPTGQYGMRHIARWSVSMASCEAPKHRHQASARTVFARRTPWSSSSSS
jgi:hypothetical protein